MSYVKTYNGKKINVDEMSHQHISNWIHYSTYVVPDSYTQIYFQVVLDLKFNGELLPYKPHSNYEYEIKMLKDKGYLRPNGDVVIYNPDGTNEKIGEVDYGNGK